MSVRADRINAAVPRARLLAPLVVLVLLMTALSSGPAVEAAEPQARTDFPIIWTGTVDVTATAHMDGVFATSATYGYSDLEPTGRDSGYYTSRTVSGSRVDQGEWCALHRDYRGVNWTWSGTGPSGTLDFPALRLSPTGVPGEAALHVSSFGVGAQRTHTCTAGSSPAVEDWILNPLMLVSSAETTINFRTSPEDADVLLASGSATVSSSTAGEGYELDISYNLTGRYDFTCGWNFDDADNDRLPDSYESTVTLTDPEKCDTDRDGFRDALEVASGSNPTSAAETPDTLPAGAAAATVSGTGEVGVTCGRSRFAWVSPTLRPLGVPAGAKSCVFLLSNETAQGLVATAFSTEKGSVTWAITDYMRAHLGEINGHERVDWRGEAEQHAAVWGTSAYAKQALARGLNLTRLNAAFAVGQLTGLAGVALGAVWKLNQIQNRDACIQVRIGTSAQGANLSWSLVYSSEQLTSAGLKDGLHRAGVWQKKVRIGPDTAVRRHANLSCTSGRVKAAGGAGAVFDQAVSQVN
jgi:hypothetical protein